MTPNVRRWARGAIGACISGGAMGVGAVSLAVYKDPKDWGDVGHGLLVFVSMFIFAALVSLAKYLYMHPLWDGEDSPERRGTGQ